MRHLIIIITLSLATTFPARTLSQSKSDNTTNEVLQKVLDRINSYESISNNYYRSINYFSENYQHETSGAKFLDG